MRDEILRMVSTEGVWALLSFLLIYYILQMQGKRDCKQEEREEQYRSLLLELTDKFEKLHLDITEIKNKMNF